MSAAQLRIEFEPGTVDRYPELIDAVRAAVFSSARMRKQIAADCDMSPSALSRIIHEGGDLALKVEQLPALLDAIPDTRHMVIDWLIERYVDTEADREQRCPRSSHHFRRLSSNGSCVAAPAFVETAVTVLPGRRVSLGLGVTQQHQTAHGAISSRPGWADYSTIRSSGNQFSGKIVL